MTPTILFLVPTENKSPVGGIKVIYQQAELIASQFGARVNAEVLHVPETGYRFEWFRSSPRFRDDGLILPERDLVVVPEVMVASVVPQLLAGGFRYAIYVQNGYLISAGTDMASMAQAYAGASIIMTISDDASDCVEWAYPGSRARIVRLQWSLDPALFRSALAKPKLITYMPRKLPRHSATAAAWLSARLPAGWGLLGIDGVTEARTAELLGLSRIFMAFSEMEGLPLPPMEAAFAGNTVVGYTGEGAREYWDRPIFHEVRMGDIRGFCDTVLALAQASPETWVDEHPSQRARLVRQFSRVAEIECLEVFVRRVEAVMGTGG